METLPIGALFEPAKGQPTVLEQSRLSQQDFLQVLVAQLRNQNPLEPQADSEFMSQIAQFEQLAALEQLNDTLSALTGLSLLGQASGLLGHEIEAVADNGDLIAGVVESVEISGGQPLLIVNGMMVPVSAVTAVR